MALLTTEVKMDETKNFKTFLFLELPQSLTMGRVNLSYSVLSLVENLKPKNLFPQISTDLMAKKSELSQSFQKCKDTSLLLNFRTLCTHINFGTHGTHFCHLVAKK